MGTLLSRGIPLPLFWLKVFVYSGLGGVVVRKPLTSMGLAV